MRKRDRRLMSRRDMEVVQIRDLSKCEIRLSFEDPGKDWILFQGHWKAIERFKVRQ